MSDMNTNIAMLEDILEKGIRKLLDEVRRQNITKAPYGRKPEPSPLISEEDFVKVEHNKIEDDGGDEPTFNFDFGFNPLKFLGDYIEWSHPTSIQARHEQMMQAAKDLQRRAKNALKQLNSFYVLRDIAANQSSGIMWGPITSPLNSTSVIAVAQSLRTGMIVSQIARESDFSEIEQTLKVSCSFSVPSKTIFENLNPGVRYFIRCCLEEDTADTHSEQKGAFFNGIDMGISQQSSFWTLPSADTNSQALSGELNVDTVHCAPLSLTFYSSDISQGSIKLDNEEEMPNEFTISCFLGDMFSTRYPSGDSDDADSTSIYSSQIWNIFRLCPLMCSSTSPCRNSSILIGWNDSRLQSDVDMKLEEAAYTQYTENMEKYMKKYGAGGGKSKSSTKVRPPEPTINRPEFSKSLSYLLQGFPIGHEEASTRHIYKSHRIGPHVEVFVLDFRNGYLCKEQAKWLTENLKDSTALWKIVLSGMPIAISCVENDSNVLKQSCPSAHSGGEGSADKRQARQQKAIDRDDVDTLGRQKNSLSHIIFSAQQSMDRVNSNDGEVEVIPDSQSNADTGVANNASNKELISEPESNQEISGSKCELIDSGILFVSSNTPSVGLPGRAYVATFDPMKTGRSFCAEINIGSTFDSRVTKSAALKLTPNLETRMLQGDESVLKEIPETDFINPHSCKLQLNSDGSILISLVSLADRTTPVYHQLFRVGKH